MLNSALQTVFPTMIILRVREGEANKWGLKPQHLWPGFAECTIIICPAYRVHKIILLPDLFYFSTFTM